MWTVNVFLGLLRGAFGRIAISSFFKGLPKMLMKLSMCHTVGQGNMSLLIGAHRLCHKLWGILDDLVLLIDRGCDGVFIQTDNLEIVKAIQEKPSNESNSALIRRIHQPLTQIGHKHIRHISREDNQNANRLVKLAQHRTYDLYLYEVSPLGGTI
ncbi:hypothetical protein Goshw_017896 [Gossypium schwendimanii]|uniref:RNase H type-1 domain-containing protein n=1 Tax=Gossypium schwendimanii TaxID=34291 RepID=A0A7J9LNQ0_GOSSC|nr:hypothetical protein [Gossypium schwendimanii]